MFNKPILLVAIIGAVALYLGLSGHKMDNGSLAVMQSQPVAQSMPAAVPVAQMVAMPMQGQQPEQPVQQMMTQPQTAAEQAALAPTSPNTTDPVPANFIPRKLKVFEGHWQGMDGRLMTIELARKLRFPVGLQGILLGEVTLNAANSGLMAGDVIIKIDGTPVATMEQFQEVTRQGLLRNESQITAIRKEGRTFRTLTLTIRDERALGFVQLEGAPMIQPGDPRPHPYRGPCTDCHTVGTGFELAPDPDLISLPPPVITRRTADTGISPHEDRGPCEACHVIR